jgi:hypothetical protein
MEQRIVVLRDERTDGDSRYLCAKYSENGDLLIEGHDLGAGVREFFGYFEYEWVWTIEAADLPRLAAALGADSNLLDALKARFSGDAAAEIGSFLKEHEIPNAFWNRIGD